MVDSALKTAGVTKEELSAIAFTRGPRITSYNVCYTKLLRFLFLLASQLFQFRRRPVLHLSLFGKYLIYQIANERKIGKLGKLAAQCRVFIAVIAVSEKLFKTPNGGNTFAQTEQLPGIEKGAGMFDLGQLRGKVNKIILGERSYNFV